MDIFDQIIYLLFALCMVNVWYYYLTDYRKLSAKGKVRALELEIKALLRDAKALDTPSTFSKCAKLERQANKKEKECELLKADASVHPSLLRAISALKYLVCTALCYQFWYSPIAYIPTELIAPMTNRMSFPHKYPEDAGTPAMSGISMMGWLFVCDRAASGLVSAIDSVAAY